MAPHRPFFPHLAPRTEGEKALARFEMAHAENPTRIEQLHRLGAQALASAGAVLGVDPVQFGFGLQDGQIASALTANAPLVSAEITERRLELAVACLSGWAEGLARTLRRDADQQANRLTRLAQDIRNEHGRMQHLLYREGTLRHTSTFVLPAAEPAEEEAS
jgi:hypothetical protein